MLMMCIPHFYAIQSRAARYLGFLMLDVAMWVLSESAIRQLIFARASLSGIFAYLTVELSGVFAIMYFDEVQHRKHHKVYRIVEAVMEYDKYYYKRIYS